jgi:hypothetical protein
MDVLDLRAYQPVHHQNLQNLRQLAATKHHSKPWGLTG